MKRFSSLALLILLSSCSLADYTRRTLLGENPEEAKKKKKKSKSHRNYVSMQQYDDLLRKYEALREKSKQGKDTSIDNPAAALHSPSTSQILKELGNAKTGEAKAKPSEDTGLVDTVDVFNGKGSSSQKMPTEKYQRPKSKVSLTIDDRDPPSVQENKHIINKFFAAKKSYLNNDMKNALPRMKELERSRNDQVRVRALYYIGRIHMEQREFDLALQVFEELIESHAYSSYVLSTLKELIKCTDKLNLHKKRAKYESLLRDIFGLG